MGIKQDLNEFYEVKYEDILKNPKTSVLEILDFCELEHPQENNVDFWKELSQCGHRFP